MNLKKGLILAGVAIVAFYVITQPANAGGTIQDILGFLRDSATAVITFVGSAFG